MNSLSWTIRYFIIMNLALAAIFASMFAATNANAQTCGILGLVTCNGGNENSGNMGSQPSAPAPSTPSDDEGGGDEGGETDSPQ
ncbi:MAG: hypothetical protein WBC71_02285 [Salaquimonas sp.]